MESLSREGWEVKYCWISLDRSKNTTPFVIVHTTCNSTYPQQCNEQSGQVNVLHTGQEFKSGFISWYNTLFCITSVHKTARNTQIWRGYLWQCFIIDILWLHFKNITGDIRYFRNLLLYSLPHSTCGMLWQTWFIQRKMNHAHQIQIETFEFYFSLSGITWHLGRDTAL